jgi:SAM-dependent methyltransferase
MSGEDWSGDERLRKRVYEDYDTYVEHQASKFRVLKLEAYSKLFIAALKERLEKLVGHNAPGRGASVLCLGARNGAECRAFTELGLFAIGVDVNPGEDNPFVVSGDFHKLQFADESVDIVYTNALDHAYDLDVVIAEIERVLKPGGVFIAEIVRGSKDEDGREPGAFEAVWWDRSAIVADMIARTLPDRIASERFEQPWVGDQHLFRKRPIPVGWRRFFRRGAAA